MVSHLSTEMAKLGYYSIIYNWFGGYGECADFEAGELNAAYLPDYSDYDGIMTAFSCALTLFLMRMRQKRYLTGSENIASVRLSA